MIFKNIQDWAEHYYNLGIYVFPVGTPFNWAKDWRHRKQTIEEVRQYSWTSQGVKGVAGGVGIRVLVFNVENTTDTQKTDLINKVLKMLNLNRYPWVIERSNRILIPIYSGIGNGSMSREDFGGAYIYWEHDFTLPTPDSVSRFFFRGMPLIRPKAVNKDILLNCAKAIGEEIGASKRFWTLEEFAYQFGQMKVLYELENKEHVSLKKAIFTDQHDVETEVYIANNLKEYNAKAIAASKDHLSVRILESGHYCLCKEWEDVDL